MKTKAIKLLLLLLSLVPIATVQLAAQSALADTEGEELLDNFRERIAEARAMLFPNGELAMTKEQILENLSISLDTDDPDLIDEEFRKHIDILIEKGLIEWEDRNVISRTPSIWGAGM